MINQTPYVSIFSIDGALMCVHQTMCQSWKSVMSWSFGEVKAKIELHTQMAQAQAANNHIRSSFQSPDGKKKVA